MTAISTRAEAIATPTPMIDDRDTAGGASSRTDQTR